MQLPSGLGHVILVDANRCVNPKWVMEQSAKWRYLTYIKLPSHLNNPPQAFPVFSLFKGYRYAARLTKDLANTLLSRPSLSFHPLLSDHVREVGLPLPSHRLIVDGCETRVELCDNNEAVENVTNPGTMYARLRRAWCKTLTSWYVVISWMLLKFVGCSCVFLFFQILLAVLRTPIE